MSTTKGFLLAGCLAASAGAMAQDAPAADATATSRFDGLKDIDYVSVLGNYVRQDSHRSDERYGAGLSLIFGQHFASGWGWEANYSNSTMETGSTGGGDYYVHTLGGDVVYSFGDRQRLTPFLLAGAGGAYDDVHPRVNGGVSGYVNAGAGLVTGTFWHNRLRLRAEVRAIHDFNTTPTRDGFTDFRAGIGLEIPFYEVTEPTAPPPPPAPEQVVQVVEKEVQVQVPVPTGLEDSDGDGVVDNVDKCPDTPAGTRVDGDGCPIPKVLRLDGVTFEFNKARLRPDSETILNRVVEIMKKYPDMQVELAGYTDSVGSAKYNLKLSQARAESVKAYLSGTGGIDAARIKAKGYGKENPVADNATEDGREHNRRVELHILN